MNAREYKESLDFLTVEIRGKTPLEPRRRRVPCSMTCVESLANLPGTDEVSRWICILSYEDVAIPAIIEKKKFNADGHNVVVEDILPLPIKEVKAIMRCPVHGRKWRKDDVQ